MRRSVQTIGHTVQEALLFKAQGSLSVSQLTICFNHVDICSSDAPECRAAAASPGCFGFVVLSQHRLFIWHHGVQGLAH